MLNSLPCRSTPYHRPHIRTNERILDITPPENRFSRVMGNASTKATATQVIEISTNENARVSQKRQMVPASRHYRNLRSGRSDDRPRGGNIGKESGKPRKESALLERNSLGLVHAVVRFVRCLAEVCGVWVDARSWTMAQKRLSPMLRPSQGADSVSRIRRTYRRFGQRTLPRTGQRTPVHSPQRRQ
jgi:hypothetical protein